MEFTDNYLKIRLPGSDDYWDAWEIGEALEQRFSGQDCYDFASACNHNDWGPLTDRMAIADLMLVKQGEGDGEDWIWLIRLMNGEHWFAIGGCDYTGWDCQSYLNWEQYVP